MIALLRDQGSKKRYKASTVGMGVTKHVRGRGMGRALFTAAIERAKRFAGLEQLLPTDVLPNEPAYRLYHARGFVT